MQHLLLLDPLPPRISCLVYCFPIEFADVLLQSILILRCVQVRGPYRARYWSWDFFT